MIFKTLLTDLSKVTGVVNNLKEVRALANGASGLLNQDSVSSLSAAIKGLNLQQAQLALSFKHLTQEQMNQVLVQAGLIAGENKIQAELLQTTLAQSTLTQEQKKAILTELDLINRKTGEILVNKSCTKEKLLEVLATKGITGAKADEIITTLGLTGANAGLKVSYEVLMGTLKKFLVVLAKNPLTWIAVAGVAIWKISDALTVTAKEAKESYSEFEKITSEIESLNNELDETKDRINELNTKKNLSLVESEELENLKETNRQLEIEIKNRETIARQKGKKANDDAVKYFNNTDIWKGIYDNSQERYLNRLESFEYELNRISKLREQQAALGDDIDSDYYKMLQGQIDSANKYVGDLLEDFMETDDALMNGMDEGLLQKLQELYRLYDITMNDVAQTYTDTIKGAFEKVDFEGVKDKLIALEQEGKLSVNVLSTDFASLVKVLNDAGVSAETLYQYIQSLANPNAINSTEVRKQLWASMGLDSRNPGRVELDNASIVSMFEERGLLTDEALTAYISVRTKFEGKTDTWTPEDWAAHIEEELNGIEVKINASFSDIFALENSEGELNTLGQLNEQLDNIQSAYNSLKEAMDNYSATGTITIDQFQDIISHGSKFLDYLNLEEGALNLDEEAMYKLAEARIIEMKAQIVQSIVDNVTGIKNETEAATYLASTNYELAESYHELAEAQLDAWYTNAIDNGLDIGVADEVIAKAKNDIAKINAMKIDINSIYSGSSSTSPSELLEKEINALEKAAEAGTITYKEYLKERERLVEDYYKRGKISAEEYYAELEKLAQAQVDYYDKVLAAVERRFDREIDKIQDTIDEIEKQNELLDKQKDLYDSALSAIQDFLDTEKEKYQDQIDNIEDENDAIQDQIDKYDQLLNAVTLVFDEKREAIQSEIDVIDERIEKLQEENDEYQKQLELEKAKDALLKARNQRSKYLYAGAGKGFIYQTDRDAIAEAEETLSNLTFQSTVDALEKEKELLQDVIDKLSETEQKWAEISNAFDDQKAKSSAQELFGDNYEDIILNGDPEMIASIMNQYTSAQQKLEDNESLITSINEKITKLDELSEKWNDISSAYEDGVNRQNAALLLGNEWQSLILADRQIDYDNFKNSYLAIQAQIDSNQSLIDSYNEKIEYYQYLKDEWSAITTSVQENIDEQLLKQEFGKDYEKDLFDIRSKNVDNFRIKYEDAQRKIAEAAEESARRQVEAAKLANGAGNPEIEKELDIPEADTSTTPATKPASKPEYRIVNKYGSVMQGGFSTEEDAKNYLKYVLGNNKDLLVKEFRNGIEQKYHTGLDQGYVGGSKFRPMSDDERLNILRRASVSGLKNNEVPTILEEGELVLNREQIKGITNSLVAPDYYSGLVKGLSSIPQGIQNRESSVVQHVTVTLPNVTNTGGYENFVKALNQLSNDALQFSKRR